MQPIAKFIALSAALLTVGVAAVAALAPTGMLAIEPCEDKKTLQTSPDGRYVAELLIHTCAWGFGQAAETVDVNITKLGNGGWFTRIPIEYDSTTEDQGTTTPSLRWTGIDELSIDVVSMVQTGTLISSRLGLKIVRRYGNPRTQDIHR